MYEKKSNMKNQAWLQRYKLHY